MKLIIKKKLLKTLVYALEFLAVGLIAYLIISPALPNIEYELYGQVAANQAKWQDLNEIKKETAQIINHLPKNTNVSKANRIIIPKIGVNSPIIESNNAKYALNRGAWHTPTTSTPDKGSNMVISGHRYKYLPPNNLTFYLLDKLVVGDMMSVQWQGIDYYYRVKQTKIVEPTEVSILNPTAATTLTVYTCDPIYSQEHRLVVIGELVE